MVEDSEEQTNADPTAEGLILLLLVILHVFQELLITQLAERTGADVHDTCLETHNKFSDSVSSLLHWTNNMMAHGGNSASAHFSCEISFFELSFFQWVKNGDHHSGQPLKMKVANHR